VQQRRERLLLATAAGALFGVSDVAVKHLTHAHGPLLGLSSPWTLTAMASFLVSFYASARSLQVGLAIEVIAITAVTANLARILGGILIFGESIDSGAIGITGRVLAFLLVIGGAAMIPAPLRVKPPPPTPSPDHQSHRGRGSPQRQCTGVGRLATSQSHRLDPERCPERLFLGGRMLCLELGVSI
jgi:hypothetical protein